MWGDGKKCPTFTWIVFNIIGSVELKKKYLM